LGTSSKQKKRSVDFSSAIRMLSDMQDQKVINYTEKFTTTLSSLKIRLEALEDLVMSKLGISEDEMNESALVRVERQQEFKEVDTPVVAGSIVRVKVKEELEGNESDANKGQDSFMAVGHNQINAAIDVMILGASKGETRKCVLPDPSKPEVSRVITATVVKVFQGQEVANDSNQSQSTGS